MASAFTKPDDSAPMSGHYAILHFNFFVSAVPMTIFSAVILGFVFHNRVLRDSDSTSNDSGAVFVRHAAPHPL
jgi:hypothetical protein